ncbi:methyltransferase domain-containing protein [Maridesulfovibrio sp. FT414]|uniref:methyltransferase domain-containing protein n=1 Tax=Maridesulfovibrio sp. FT414 TaxID=2979469 RepID=UPI003D80A0F4
MYDKSALIDHVLSFVDIQSGDAILDVGCGDGQMLHAASWLVDGGSFFGLDMLPASIQRAESFTCGDDRLHFSVHDVDAGLPYSNEMYECVVCCNVLECINEKGLLLREMHRVLKKEGRLVVSHFDYDTIVFNVEDRDIYRKILHAYSDWKQPWMKESDPWTGRKLCGIINKVSTLFSGGIQSFVLHETEYRNGTKGYSFVKEEVRDLVKHGVIAAYEYELFLHDIENSVRNNEYFFSINMYSFVGDKV